MRERQNGSYVFVLSPIVSKSVSVFCFAAYFLIALVVLVVTVYLFLFAEETLLVVVMAWLLCVSVFLLFERMFWYLFARRYPMSIEACGESAIVRYVFGVKRKVKLESIRIVDNGLFVTIEGLAFFAIRLPRD